MSLPDLTPLIYLAMFGLLCAAILIVTAMGFAGYHLWAALSMYIAA